MNFFAKNTPRGSPERMMRAVPRLALRRGSGPGFQLPDGVEKPTRLDCTSYRVGQGCGLAAVYLLSAREALWERTEAALSPENIRWGRSPWAAWTPHSYALYKAAKGIRHGRSDIQPPESEGPDLTHDDTLLLVANAVLLAQYGRTMPEIGDTN